ncbi:aldose 1-epimerase [Panacibacter sp. DH6]|uniref:Aldose 1-epimerase n=1 Tax=Panacibacter microcysteis TaxID=2793269 RepID=A0A931E694_9BACT|nr:aldose 1-epimerase [Panacibacter microcysteis]MBG9376251.1 aldose 1-epimerase [Panacibacter microcysteis]
MACSVSITKQGEENIILLQDNISGCTAEIYSFGALLNTFAVPVDHKPVNVIDGFISMQDAVANVSKGFKSTKLSPFVCRLKNGEYTFNSVAHKIKKFYMGSAAIHGLLFDQSFKVKEHGADEHAAYVVLLYTYNKTDEGFPFGFEMEVTYKLHEENRLLLSTKVTNKAGTAIPISDGWHPYFTFGVKVDELLVQFNSRRMVVFDNGLLPTGDLVPYTTFARTKRFGNTALDNCFELAATNEVSCTIRNPFNGLQLSITPAASYPYLQIFTPNDRRSIAIENLSSVPDAFNNGIGLIVLPPGNATTFETTYQLAIV